MRSLAHRALNCAGSVYWRLRAWPPVWNFLNREARRRWAAHPVALAPIESALAASLAERGIAVCHIDELLPGAFTELADFAERRWASPEARAAVRERMVGQGRPAGRKSFLVNLWPGQPLDRTQDMAGGNRGGPLIEPDHPFVRFSLSEPVLRVVNAYLLMFCKFRFWHLEATIPLQARPVASQRWHRDPEDVKLVKVFLYLNDVTESAGPFMYLAGSHPGGSWRHLFPIAPPRGSPKMPPDADEGRFIPHQDVVTAAGRAGTLIFCDTTGLHRGGLARAGHRLMYTSVYTSSASPWPIRYAIRPKFRNFEMFRGLSLAAKFALNNDPSQREPRFYR